MTDWHPRSTPRIAPKAPSPRPRRRATPPATRRRPRVTRAAATPREPRRESRARRGTRAGSAPWPNWAHSASTTRARRPKANAQPLNCEGQGQRGTRDLTRRRWRRSAWPPAGRDTRGSRLARASRGSSLIFQYPFQRHRLPFQSNRREPGLTTTPRDEPLTRVTRRASRPRPRRACSPWVKAPPVRYPRVAGGYRGQPRRPPPRRRRTRARLEARRRRPSRRIERHPLTPPLSDFQPRSPRGSRDRRLGSRATKPARRRGRNAETKRHETRSWSRAARRGPADTQ